MAKKNNAKEKASKESEKKTTAADEGYIIMKKNQIKDAVDKGNYAKARRHAVEIQQYLGNGDNEMPIEDQLDPLE